MPTNTERLAPTDSLGNLITDGGPIYVETNLHHFVAEPFNAISAILFLGVAAWWAVRLWGKFQKHTFMTVALILLMIGGIGGSLYHAFRVSPVFLVMDWLPILLISFGASIYFFRQISGSWLSVILGLIAFSLLQWVNFSFVPRQISVNVSYTLMALAVLIPTILLLRERGWKNAGWVAGALGAFVLAISFRAADATSSWHMGTHFLWHVFGAVACHCMFEFTYRLNSPNAGTLNG